MIARVFMGVAAGVVLAAVLVIAWKQPVESGQIIASPPPPVGTFMYLQLEGPVLLAWDTRTGAAKVCMVRQGGVECP